VLSAGLLDVAFQHRPIRPRVFVVPLRVFLAQSLQALGPNRGEFFGRALGLRPERFLQRLHE
jgi:hypothetical protein